MVCDNGKGANNIHQLGGETIMQIREMVLYGYNGKVRHLEFHPGKLNIITGEQKAGKSAVGDIIDYCLGSRNCDIADGVVRDCVAWFGLLLQFESERIFVARENPGAGNQTTFAFYYEIGKNIEVPEHGEFVSNTNRDGIIAILNEHLGIGENLHIPPAGQTRNPLAATIRHALFFCFQGQEEIAAKTILFHKQSETYTLQAIKDTLPYFLGAVREDELALAEELRLKRRKLRELEQEKKELELLSGADTARALSLLAEATAVGLITVADPPSSKRDLRKTLETISNCKIDEIVAEYTEGSRLAVLQKQWDEVEEKLDNLKDEIQSAEEYKMLRKQSELV